MRHNILHIADLHIRDQRRDAQMEVFGLLFQHCAAHAMSAKNDGAKFTIVVCGDIFHTKAKLTPHSLHLGSVLFKGLARIAPVVMIPGNHDFNTNNSEEVDLISPFVSMISNDQGGMISDSLHQISYYRHSGCYRHDDITFCVTSPTDDVITAQHIPPQDRDTFKVALFHEPVVGTNDFGTRCATGRLTLDTFSGCDLALGGHIHLRQIMGNKPMVAYCGSLIQQNAGEPFGGHGYILWKISDKQIAPELYDIDCSGGFVSFDYCSDQLAAAPPRLPPNLWGVTCRFDRCSPAFVQSESDRIYGSIKKAPKVVITNSPCDTKAVGAANAVSISKEVARIDVNNAVGQLRAAAEGMRDIEAQARLVLAACQSAGYPQDFLDAVVVEHRSRMVANPQESTYPRRWAIKTLAFDNLFCFGGGNYVDFRALEGCLSGVVAPNRSGKTSLLDIIHFILYDTIPRGDRNTKKSIVVNTRTGHPSYSCELTFTYTDEHGVEQEGFIRKSGTNGGGSGTDYKTLVEFGTGQQNFTSSSITETMANIREWLGEADDSAACCFAMDGGRESNILDMAPADRKKLLTRALGLNILDDLHVAVTADLKDVSAKINTLRGATVVLSPEELQARCDERQQISDEIISNERRLMQIRESRATVSADLTTSMERSKTLESQIADVSSFIERMSSIPVGAGDTSSIEVFNAVAALGYKDALIQAHNTVGSVTPAQPSLSGLQQSCGVIVNLKNELASLQAPLQVDSMASIITVSNMFGVPTDKGGEYSATLLQTFLRQTIDSFNTFNNITKTVPVNDSNLTALWHQQPKEFLRILGEFINHDKPHHVAGHARYSAWYDARTTRSKWEQTRTLAENDVKRVEHHIQQLLKSGLATQTHITLTQGMTLDGYLQTATDLTTKIFTLCGATKVAPIFKAAQVGAKDGLIAMQQHLTTALNDMEQYQRHPAVVGEIFTKLQPSLQCGKDEGCPHCSDIYEVLSRIADTVNENTHTELTSAINIIDLIIKNLAAALMVAKQALQNIGPEPPEAGPENEDDRASCELTRFAKSWVSGNLPTLVQTLAVIDQFCQNNAAQIKRKQLEVLIAQEQSNIDAQIVAIAKMILPNVKAHFINLLNDLVTQEKDVSLDCKSFQDMFNDLNQQESSLSRVCNDLREKIGRISALMEKAKESTVTVAELEQRANVLAVYKEVLSPTKGIAAMMLQQNRELLVRVVNHFLGEYTDFTVDIDEELKLYINDNGTRLSIVTASGFQRFAISLAFRLALGIISISPKPDCLIMDEGFGCLDQENLEQVAMFLKDIATKTRLVFIVTHIDHLQAALDKAVVITKDERGISKVCSGAVHLTTTAPRAGNFAMALKRPGMIAKQNVESTPNLLPRSGGQPFVLDANGLTCYACNARFTVGQAQRHLNSKTHQKAVESFTHHAGV